VSVGWWVSESVSEKLVGELVSWGKGTAKKLATAMQPNFHETSPISSRQLVSRGNLHLVSCS
jgi:hypothetical protein